MIKNLLLGAIFAFAMIATTGCYEKTAAVTTPKISMGAGKCDTEMQGKCGTGKCGTKLKDKGMKCGAGKCDTGKCGTKLKDKGMKCGTGKCGSAKGAAGQ